MLKAITLPQQSLFALCQIFITPLYKYNNTEIYGNSNQTGAPPNGNIDQNVILKTVNGN